MKHRSVWRRFGWHCLIRPSCQPAREWIVRWTLLPMRLSCIWSLTLVSDW